MACFDNLQTRFVAAELAAFGLSSQGAVILQPPAVLADGDDAALWAWFNVIPQPGPIYVPSGSDFFTAYSEVIGALVSSGGPLDPISAAQKRLADWGAAPPTWSNGYTGLSNALAGAASLAFDFAAPPPPQPAFWGLIGGAQTPGPGDTFASGATSADVTFAHLLPFAPQPGDWYVSSALSLAYRTPGASPWNPTSPVTWDTTFGPNGTLRQMVAALLVVSSLDVSASSSASFDAANQRLVKAGIKVDGAWPYYLPPAAAATKATFDADGCLSLAIRSQRKTAIAIAAVVQSAATYLGA